VTTTPIGQHACAAGREAGAACLPERFRIETRDLGEGCDLIARAYGPVRISTPDPDPVIRLAGLAAGPLRLGQADLRMNLDYETGPAGQVLVGYIAAGVVRRRDPAGQEAVFGPGDVAMLRQPGECYRGQSHGARVRTVSFEASLMSQVADGLAGRAPAPVRFTGTTAVSAAAAQRLRATVDFAWELAASRPAADHEPLVTGSAARLLAAITLDTFPNTATDGPSPGDCRDASSATLDRAVDFIHDRAGSDVSVADIAAAAKVSVRAVQLAFRRELDVTPMAYLRQVRLERAHQDLLAAGPAGATVTDVSARWGFPSSSRFAAYYREAFGVPPNHTRHLAS
jgi:AraC-like DNA-binding protein